MSNDNKTLADVQPGGRVRLGDGLLQKAYDDLRYYVDASPCELAQRGISREDALDIARESEAALSAQTSTGETLPPEMRLGSPDYLDYLDSEPSPGGQGEALPPLPPKDVVDTHLPTGVRIYGYTAEQMQGYARAALAARQPVGEPFAWWMQDDNGVGYFSRTMQPAALFAYTNTPGYSATPLYATAPAQAVDLGAMRDVARKAFSAALPGSEVDAELRKLLALIDSQPVGQSFQTGVAEWMGQCFLPSLYSNMTERGDRLLEEVLELLQAHGYDKARVPTLVDYVFSRPVGDPAQEVGGVMVTLAGYCWVAGLDMHAAGDAELARINQPDVMAKIRAKQEAKNALHVDTPLPGDPATIEDWPREGDLVRYGDGSSALAIRLGPHAGGWHGYQCCGGYTFFTKAYRPTRADMDTWLDCAKYRDERTKVADNRVAHEMYMLDNKAASNG